MSVKKFLFSWLFLKNLLLAVVLVIVLVLITMTGLNIYTHHGDSYPMPDFSGMTETQVDSVVKKNGLRYSIIDSIYNPDALPGAVLDQIPKPGFKVKKNRRVLLTINSSSPEQVILPKLRDISFRQAQVLIENCGLKLGKVKFIPSEYNELVLDVVIDSTKVYAGEKWDKGTSVDLIIGKGFGLEKTTVPDVIGLLATDAQIAITDALLNLGVVIYDQSFTSKDDSLNAVVWRQRPNPKIVSSVDVGSSIDIWVTVDDLKINEAIESDF